MEVKTGKWDLGQIISGVAVIIGVAVEFGFRADIGFVLISLGGLSWGIFTKLKGK